MILNINYNDQNSLEKLRNLKYFLKDDDPSETDVVKRYGSEERVWSIRATTRVILVPIDARVG